ncbi:MAG: hypothetical protein K9J72_05205 [Synechococcus sp. Tobar2m-G35]|nr:hypothetical protein [Synechococcus sp. Tobar2m-G35]
MDDDLKPYPDQWVYLASLQRLSLTALQTVIQTATGGGHPLDLAFMDEEDLATPWKQRPARTQLSGPLPASLNLTLADRLYVERSGLPQPLLNRLIRLAAFANPAFYKAQAMRLSVWDKPRVIGCAEKARYVLGLSATLVRRDGLQPILFLQCGPIRHTAERPAGAPQTLELVSRTHQLPALPADLPIQELMRRLAEDPHRTDRIVAEALACCAEGRKLLLLSERTDHITAIAAALTDQVPSLFLLHGRLSARQRSAILATGRLVGEGFDHPSLGTLQQYAGRLHRQQAGKTSVRIIDWLDLGHPITQRMWERRLRGYRAMGYALISDP